VNELEVRGVEVVYPILGGWLYAKVAQLSPNRDLQVKLLEMAQANMQFAFEFAQRLATIRSPVEFLSVTAEFTSKRSALFRKHSKEMAEFSIRW
jgi:hypothetical protein